MYQQPNQVTGQVSMPQLSLYERRVQGTGVVNSYVTRETIMKQRKGQWNFGTDSPYRHGLEPHILTGQALTTVTKHTEYGIGRTYPQTLG